MKVEKYGLSGPIKNLWKQNCIVGYTENNLYPLFYIQRPKSISDDGQWGQIVKSIRMELPLNFELSDQ